MRSAYKSKESESEQLKGRIGSINDNIRQYEKDNDIVLQFLEERCKTTDEGYTRAKTLYDTYKIWCKSNGYYTCSMKKFCAEITAHPEWYHDRKQVHGVYCYEGLALREN